jgi:hypothetical protein
MEITEKEKVELYLSCHSLTNLDFGSKSDPYCVLYRKQGNNWHQVGKTEIVWNNLDPSFAKSFEIEFTFERKQIFKVECRDADDEQGLKYDSLGSAEFELGTVIGSVNSTLVLNLIEKNKKMGQVSIRVENLPFSDEMVCFKFEGEEIGATSYCFKEKPYFTISKYVKLSSKSDSTESTTLIQQREWQKVFDSELGKGDFHKFNEASIRFSKLCSGDDSTSLKVGSAHQFTLYTSLFCDNHKYKGEFTTTLKELQGGLGKSFKFTNHTSNKEHGSLKLVSFSKQKNYSMIDFLRGGTQIALMLGIDFTASNGTPTNSSSLHYFDKNSKDTLNQYQQAILSIGDILLNYDSDKLVAAPHAGPRLRLRRGAQLPDHEERRPQPLFPLLRRLRQPSGPRRRRHIPAVPPLPQQRLAVGPHSLRAAAQRDRQLHQELLQARPEQLLGAAHPDGRLHLRHGGHQRRDRRRLRAPAEHHHRRRRQRELREHGRARLRRQGTAA